MKNPLYSNDIAFELDQKRQDESRQGEVLVIDAPEDFISNGKSYYIESYGCQMNFNDSEIVASVLASKGYKNIQTHESADVILLNTCSIRDKAEQTIRARLAQLNKIKKTNPGTVVGILGCMAERLKEQLLVQEHLVDIVAGPDAYRSLPDLIEEATGGQKAVNVLLSREETYGDINPVRLASNGVSAFISIMRGCDNMCAFCVVPFTRGRERSRDYRSILQEAQDLYNRGFKEVTLLGQNVDSYRFSYDPTLLGKKLIEKKDTDEVVNFANLLELVAQVAPDLRVRFSTSHPKDMLDDVLHVIAKYDNVCNYIHLPVQSGSSSCLERMNRTYNREWYIDRIDAIKRIIPDCGLSTDIITGFCGETEEEHRETISLMEYAQYDMCYMFAYSERPGTLAAKRFKDDVPEEVKKRRLQEVVDLHRKHSLESNLRDIGKRQTILIEGVSKKSSEQVYGRNDANKVVIIDKGNHKKGDYVKVIVTDCTSGTLIGEMIKD
ncbi:MAG: tRNA (N6-isopentenyl adenosine(37)-C2)-methylthiotransferase MiaB [Bacteroidetes bacterium]|nr:tRNA (N6-isopentenyl adenosine(37)-C2)-methylthiotransferase MiaB [Bacteroidota bacterium]